MPARQTISVRITGGLWNGRKIRLPAAAALRPSGGRIRESLFSCLGGRLTGLRCLDLFAGSGALGFSAASRGAASVTLVEKNRRTAAALRGVSAALAADARVLAMPAERFLAAAPAPPGFDVVFLDPPFQQYAADDDWGALLAALLPHTAPGARVYCEHDRHFTPPAGWQRQTARRAGNVRWQILRPAAPAPAP